MRRAAAFALACATAACTVAACGGPGSPCDVRISGRCAALKQGRPADSPPYPSRAAEMAIDMDPPAQTLSARCRFRGIALGRYDYYRCRVRYFGGRLEMALVHDRRTRRLPMYEFRVLRRTGGGPGLHSLHGRCTPRIARACRDLPPRHR
jgi:hypothetical protein